MFVPSKGFYQDARGQRVRNVSGETIPPFSLVRLTGSDTADDDPNTFKAAKPTSDGQFVWVTGPLEIADGEAGWATSDFPMYAAYDTAETPAAGQTWGAAAGSWLLTKGKAGFRVVGDPDEDAEVVAVDRTKAAGDEAESGVGADDCGWLIDYPESKAFKLTMLSGDGRCSCIDLEQDTDPVFYLIYNGFSTWVGTKTFCTCCGFGRVSVTVDREAGDASLTLQISRLCTDDGVYTPYTYTVPKLYCQRGDATADPPTGPFVVFAAGTDKNCDGNNSPFCDNAFRVKLECVDCEDIPKPDCAACAYGKGPTAFYADLTFSGAYAAYSGKWTLAAPEDGGCVWSASCGDITAALTLGVDGGATEWTATLTLSGADGGDLTYLLTSASPLNCLGSSGITLPYDGETPPTGAAASVGFVGIYCQEICRCPSDLYSYTLTVSGITVQAGNAAGDASGWNGVVELTADSGPNSWSWNEDGLTDPSRLVECVGRTGGAAFARLSCNPIDTDIPPLVALEFVSDSVIYASYRYLGDMVCDGCMTFTRVTPPGGADTDACYQGWPATYEVCGSAVAAAMMMAPRRAAGKKPGCQTCGGGPPAPPKFDTLDAWFQSSKATPSDFHEHMDTLRQLADGCDSAAELSAWAGKPSLLALAASKAGKVLSVCGGVKPEYGQMRALRGPDRFGHLAAESLEADLPDPVDLLFLDTRHTAARLLAELERHHHRVTKYLVVHCTTTFGEKGDDGGPGVMPALREFLKRHSEWRVKEVLTNNHGLMVLSKAPEDRVPLPPLPRMALNVIGAKLGHWLSGKEYLSQEDAEKRLEHCWTCPLRQDHRCTSCGCYLDVVDPDGTDPQVPAALKGTPGRAFFPGKGCPVGKWHPAG